MSNQPASSVMNSSGHELDQRWRIVLVCLSVAAVAIGAAQLGALVVWAATATIALGMFEPNRTSLFTFPLLVATFQLTNQFLWAAPVVAGLGGALLSAHRAVRTGFALIWIGIAVELLATAQNIANWGFDAGALLSPISGRSILALPFCVALGVASMNLRSRAGVRADLLPL